MRELRVHETTMHPSAVLARISLAKNRMETPESFLESGSGGRDQLVGSVWQRYREYLGRTRALDFDDLLLETVRLLREHESVGAHYRKRYRHVLVDEYQDTNHPQYEIVRAIGGRAPQRLRGGRRRPVDLRLARRRHPQDPRLPPRLRGRQGRAPADELPLDAADPRRGQRRHSAQRLAPRQGARVGAGRGGGGPLRAAEGRDLRGAVRGRRDERGRQARPGPPGGLRRPLPHAGAVPALRGGAARGGAPLRGGRRHVLLRPQGGARRGRLPQARGEPARRDLAPARHQHSPARGRQGQHRQGPGLRHPPWHSRERGVRPGGGDRRALPAVRRGLPGPARDPRAREPRRGRHAARRPPLRLPRLRRLPRRGRPPVHRPDDPRGALGRRRGDPELRRELRAAVSRADAPRVPRGARAHQRRRAGGEAGARRRGHPHDPPRGKGPRVPPRVPGGDGGGAAAARARGGGGRGRGGAPPRLRRHHARDDDADPELGLRASEVRPALALRAFAIPVRGAGRGPPAGVGGCRGDPGARGGRPPPAGRGKKKAGRAKAGAGKSARRKPRSR